MTRITREEKRWGAVLILLFFIFCLQGWTNAYHMLPMSAGCNRCSSPAFPFLPVKVSRGVRIRISLNMSKSDREKKKRKKKGERDIKPAEQKGGIAGSTGSGPRPFRVSSGLHMKSGSSGKKKRVPIRVQIAWAKAYKRLKANENKVIVNTKKWKQDNVKKESEEYVEIDYQNTKPPAVFVDG